VTHTTNAFSNLTIRAPLRHAPWTSDEDRIARLVAAAHCTGSDASRYCHGPGYIAEAFSRFAREVIGIDLTNAMLQIAEARRQDATSPISVFVAATSSILLC